MTFEEFEKSVVVERGVDWPMPLKSDIPTAMYVASAKVSVARRYPYVLTIDEGFVDEYVRPELTEELWQCLQQEPFVKVARIEPSGPDNGWCSNCDRPVRRGFKYCPNCGAKLKEGDQ